MFVRARRQNGGMSPLCLRASTPAWARLGTVLAAVLALTALRLVYAASVELAPQEAYYWQYARHLDLSYYDHPPLSAWMIAASVRLLGTSELAVRLPAIISGGALTMLLYSLGSRLASREAGALAAALANVTVLFGIGAVLITPDVPLVLCWIAALRLLCEIVLPDGSGPGRLGWRWHILGALCGLALLSKYTAALLPVQVLATTIAVPSARRLLRSPHPWAAALIALVFFSPVVVWNARNGWASFGFQTAGRMAQNDGARVHLLARYLGLQLLAVGPLLWGTLLASIVWLLRRTGQARPRAVLLLIAGVPAVALFTAMSPWIFVKMNWVAPAYVPLLVGTAWWWSEAWEKARARRWATAVFASCAAVTAAAHLAPLVPALPFPPRADTVSGWRELSAAVERARTSAGMRDPLVIGWGYKTASELAFYLPGRPETQSSGVLGGKGLAFDYWPDGALSRDALVVADDRQPLRDPEARLADHCTSFAALEPVTVHRGSRPVTTFRLWRCNGWSSARALLQSHADVGSRPGG